MIFSGLDISGYKEKEKTVLSFIEDKKIYTFKSLSDKKIVEEIRLRDPVVFAVDSPLSFPKKGIFRCSDEKLRKFLDKKNLKYLKKSVLPPILPSMRVITRRAIKIKNSLKNIKIIETHPTICLFLILVEKEVDAKNFVSYKRDKKVFIDLLKILQKKMGYELKFSSSDELDSFICAYMAKLFYEKENILSLSKSKTPFVIYNF